jgi:hypothetical protein
LTADYSLVEFVNDDEKIKTPERTALALSQPTMVYRSKKSLARSTAAEIGCLLSGHWVSVYHFWQRVKSNDVGVGKRP